ncbi:mediator of RNA polymerase II transcription subunit 13 [Chytridiales sp. JEL 0842]|nr:mediator of RNA polymerase II transcription subunit 13 [Chytridiales sp. JEL 0842]
MFNTPGPLSSSSSAASSPLPSSSFHSVSNTSEYLPFEESSALTNIFLITNAPKVKWRKYHHTTSVNQQPSTGQRASWETPGGQTTPADGKSTVRADDIKIKSMVDVLSQTMSNDYHADSSSTGSERSGHDTQRVPPVNVSDPLLKAHFALVEAKIPSVWRLVDDPLIPSASTATSQAYHSGLATTATITSTAQLNSDLYGAATGSTAFDPPSVNNPSPMSTLNMSTPKVPETPWIPTSPAFMPIPSAGTPDTMVEEAHIDVENNSTLYSPLGYKMQVRRELWVYDLGEFDASVNPLDVDSEVSEALKNLVLELEGEFNSDALYMPSGSTGRDEFEMFSEAVCNLLERSFASEGLLRLGHSFLLTPYFMSSGNSSLEELKDAFFAESRRESLTSIIPQIFFIGSNLMVSLKLSRLRLRFLEPADLFPSPGLSGNARKVILSPSGRVAHIQLNSKAKTQSSNSISEEWTQLFGLPPDYLTPANTNSWASNSSLPETCLVYLSKEVAIEYPSRLILCPVEADHSMDRELILANLKNGFMRSSWKSDAIVAMASTTKRPVAACTPDYWRYRDPLQHLVDLTLREAGKADAEIDRLAKEEETKASEAAAQAKAKAAAEAAAATAALEATAAAAAQTSVSTASAATSLGKSAVAEPAASAPSAQAAPPAKGKKERVSKKAAAAAKAAVEKSAPTPKPVDTHSPSLTPAPRPGGNSTPTIAAGASTDLSYLAMNTMSYTSKTASSAPDMMDLELEGIGDNDFDFFGTSATPGSVSTPAPMTQQSYAATSPAFSLTAQSPFAVPATPVGGPHAAPSPAPYTPQSTALSQASPGPTSPAFIAQKAFYSSMSSVSTGQGYDHDMYQSSPAYVSGVAVPPTPIGYLPEPAAEPFQVPFVDSSESQVDSNASDGTPSQWKSLNLKYDLVWKPSVDEEGGSKYGIGGRYSYIPSSKNLDGGKERSPNTLLGKRRRDDDDTSDSGSEGTSDGETDSNDGSGYHDPFASFENQLANISQTEAIPSYDAKLERAAMVEPALYRSSLVALSLMGLSPNFKSRASVATPPQSDTDANVASRNSLSNDSMSPDKSFEMSPAAVPSLDAEASGPLAMNVDEEEEVVEEGEVNDTQPNLVATPGSIPVDEGLGGRMSLGSKAGLQDEEFEPVSEWSKSLLDTVIPNWENHRLEFLMTSKMYIEGATLGRGYRFMDEDDCHGWNDPSFTSVYKTHPTLELKVLFKISPLIGEAFPSVSTASTPSVKDSATSKGLLTIQQYFDLQEPDKSVSKYGKLQIRKKKHRPTPILEPLPPPEIELFHDQTLLKLQPTAVRFWDKLRLGPRGGPKKVWFATVCPDQPQVVQSVRVWNYELQTAWDVCGFGYMKPIKQYLGEDPGVVLVPIKERLPEESHDATRFRNYKVTLDAAALKISSFLAAYPSVQNVAVIILNPFPHRKTSHFDISYLGARLISRIAHNLGRPLLEIRTKVVPFVIPIDIALNTIAGDPLSVFMLREFCFGVYNLCHELVSRAVVKGISFSESSETKPAVSSGTEAEKQLLTKRIFSPVYSVGKAPSSKPALSGAGLSGKNTCLVPVCVSEPDRIMHVVYFVSDCWVGVCWCDSAAELVDVNALPWTVRPWSSIEHLHAVFTQIWNDTLKLFQKGGLAWRIVIGKYGWMGRSELDQWKDVFCQFVRSYVSDAQLNSASADTEPHPATAMRGQSTPTSTSPPVSAGSPSATRDQPYTYSAAAPLTQIQDTIYDHISSISIVSLVPDNATSVIDPKIALGAWGGGAMVSALSSSYVKLFTEPPTVKSSENRFSGNLKNTESNSSSSLSEFPPLHLPDSRMEVETGQSSLRGSLQNSSQSSDSSSPSLLELLTDDVPATYGVVMVNHRSPSFRSCFRGMEVLERRKWGLVVSKAVERYSKALSCDYVDGKDTIAVGVLEEAFNFSSARISTSGAALTESEDDNSYNVGRNKISAMDTIVPLAAGWILDVPRREAPLPPNSSGLAGSFSDKPHTANQHANPPPLLPTSNTSIDCLGHSSATAMEVNLVWHFQNPNHGGLNGANTLYPGWLLPDAAGIPIRPPTSSNNVTSMDPTKSQPLSSSSSTRPNLASSDSTLKGKSNLAEFSDAHEPNSQQSIHSLVGESQLTLAESIGLSTAPNSSSSSSVNSLSSSIVGSPNLAKDSIDGTLPERDKEQGGSHTRNAKSSGSASVPSQTNSPRQPLAKTIKISPRLNPTSLGHSCEPLSPAVVEPIVYNVDTTGLQINAVNNSASQTAITSSPPQPHHTVILRDIIKQYHTLRFVGRSPIDFAKSSLGSSSTGPISFMESADSATIRKTSEYIHEPFVKKMGASVSGLQDGIPWVYQMAERSSKLMNGLSDIIPPLLPSSISIHRAGEAASNSF